MVPNAGQDALYISIIRIRLLVNLMMSKEGKSFFLEAVNTAAQYFEMV